MNRKFFALWIVAILIVEPVFSQYSSGCVCKGGVATGSCSGYLACYGMFTFLPIIDWLYIIKRIIIGFIHIPILIIGYGCGNCVNGGTCSGEGLTENCCQGLELWIDIESKSYWLDLILILQEEVPVLLEVRERVMGLHRVLQEALSAALAN